MMTHVCTSFPDAYTARTERLHGMTVAEAEAECERLGWQYDGVLVEDGAYAFN